MPIVKFQTPHAGEIGVGSRVYISQGYYIDQGIVTGFDFSEDEYPEPVLVRVETGNSVTTAGMDRVFSEERHAWHNVIGNLAINRDALSREAAGLDKKIWKLVDDWGIPEGVKV